jgi:PhnB protein
MAMQSQTEPKPRVKARPEGYHSVTPYLIVSGAAKAIEFYKKALGAVELFRMDCGDGKLGHAEIKIGDSPIMLADEYPDMGYRSAQSIGATPVSILVYVDDVDSVFKRALAAGGTQLKPLQDQFYGDRSGTFTDPFGHVWTVATHIEDVPSQELNRRMQEMMKKQGA